jgi:hypothetical protein
MAKDRSRNDKRSVGSHEKMMGALGKAAGWSRLPGYARQNTGNGFFAPGHGHVTTGTRDYYGQDRIAATETLGRLNANQGLDPLPKE